MLSRPIALVLVLAAAFSVAALLFSGTSAAQPGTLYAVDGAGTPQTGCEGVTSNLYTMNPSTGAMTLVGPIMINSTQAEHVTAIAVHPSSGVLYGVMNSQEADCSDFGQSTLLSINTSTAAATVIGSNGSLAHQIPDIDFDPSGQLYGWSQGVPQDLITIDISNGTSAFVADCGCSTSRTGLAIMSSGAMYMKSGGGSGPFLSRINPASGTIIDTLALDSNPHNLLAFDPGDVLFTGTRDGTAGTFTLQTINHTTGVVSDVGTTSVSALISAIAFDRTPPPASAGPITVTSDADADPPDDDGQCSLREAIDNANDDALTHADCEAGTGEDTIVFGGDVTLVTLAADLPDITDADGLTIDGADTVTVSGSNLYRPFRVEAVAGLTLQDLISTNGFSASPGGNIVNLGTLTLIGSQITNSNSTAAGGIFNQSGEVHLNSSQVTGNSASGNGGGIANSFGGTLTLTSSDVTGNTAANYGGGIGSDGDVTLIDSVVSGNTATTKGGGGFESQGVLTITNSTISGNTAATRGGGIDNVEGAQATIIDSTISGNSGGGTGGGIFMEAAATMTMTGSTLSGNSATTGGGIRANTGTATLANSTVSDNEAEFGGGIYNGENTTITLINVTITQNVALISGGGLYNPGDAPGAFMLTNTIVADQQSGEDCGGSGTFVTQGNNLDSDDTCSLNPGTDISSGSANLGSLADNGGLTETHALLLGSDAIDAGDDTDCVAPPVDGLDQRGVTRPQGAQCDIGAFELEVESVVWGDGNCSGSADPVDSLLTLRFDAGLSANTGDCPDFGQVVDVQNASPHPWGDVDCGGDVTPVDSLKLLRFDAGLSVSQADGCPLIGSAVLVVE